ncbi:hypothetical protein [Alcanivorax sp. DG881]|uniref:hypothetical protein n=1 Tax=Alcanivorax sp. DG881 TaxID=236097 RepID=UPI0005870635|nr:hypothetical protein [Alcanivorax sp. DG881]
METITLENSKYEFVKVGRFVKSKTPLKVRFEGKDDEVTMELELCHEDIKKVGECVYLVTVDGVPVYVGEYSRTLESRWLRSGNYIWHNKDLLIVEEVNSGRRVDFYLAKNVYVMINEREVNISKSIEHDILQVENLPWNTRNAKVDVSGVRRLAEFYAVLGV